MSILGQIIGAALVWVGGIIIGLAIGYKRGKKDGTESVVRNFGILLAKIKMDFIAQAEAKYPKGGVSMGAVMPHGEEIIINPSGKTTPVSAAGMVVWATEAREKHAMDTAAITARICEFAAEIEKRKQQTEKPDGTENE